ncbi:hypothetical protein OSB04_020853 [Centaurea solstitialis]|uniref:Uncharacterized protein n=1 Tax=Centaurea solstitialis TaxID=347529 RepID=A0AA38ST32_9ASTR|nr:hypothetical protein OSB04_020853 [Centaurea solstitialis]
MTTANASKWINSVRAKTKPNIPNLITKIFKDVVNIPPLRRIRYMSQFPISFTIFSMPTQQLCFFGICKKTFQSRDGPEEVSTVARATVLFLRHNDNGKNHQRTPKKPTKCQKKVLKSRTKRKGAVLEHVGIVVAIIEQPTLERFLHLLLWYSNRKHSVLHRSLHLVQFRIFRQSEPPRELPAASFHPVPCIVLIFLLNVPLSADLQDPVVFNLHLHFFFFDPWKIGLEYVGFRGFLPIHTVPDVQTKWIEDVASSAAEEAWNDRHFLSFDQIEFAIKKMIEMVVILGIDFLAISLWKLGINCWVFIDAIKCISSPLQNDPDSSVFVYFLLLSCFATYPEISLKEFMTALCTFDRTKRETLSNVLLHGIDKNKMA